MLVLFLVWFVLVTNARALVLSLFFVLFHQRFAFVWKILSWVWSLSPYFRLFIGFYSYQSLLTPYSAFHSVSLQSLFYFLSLLFYFLFLAHVSLWCFWFVCLSLWAIFCFDFVSIIAWALFVRLNEFMLAPVRLLRPPAGLVVRHFSLVCLSAGSVCRFRSVCRSVSSLPVLLAWAEPSGLLRAWVYLFAGLLTSLTTGSALPASFRFARHYPSRPFESMSLFTSRSWVCLFVYADESSPF
jgi:hypothetical protein